MYDFVEIHMRFPRVAAELSIYSQISNIDVILFRNNFNKMMSAPWNTNEWEINVQRLGQTLFFDIVNERNQDPAASEKRSQPSNGEQDKFTYWGYKFEELCTRDVRTASLAASAPQPVDPNNQFCGIFKLKLNEFRIILAAELDCSVSEVVAVNERSLEAGPPTKQRRVEKEFFVELKTSKAITSGKDDYSFRRYKLLSFWIQSFLVSVPRITVGFRDGNGIVNSIKHLDTLRIPGMASDLWNPWDCLNCTSDIIKVAKQLCKDPKTVYCIKFSRPFAKISIFSTERRPFIPEDFVEWFVARSRSK